MGQRPLIQLLRPCGAQHPDGKQFGEWGPMWGYHFNDNGLWVKGQKAGRGQHGGVDIRCPVGTVLQAPSDGLILDAGWQDEGNKKRGYGIRIIMEIDDLLDVGDSRFVKPILTLGHFSELWMPKGAKVFRGVDLGLSGETGNTKGAHSHVQLEMPGPYPRTPLQFEWVTV